MRIRVVVAALLGGGLSAVAQQTGTVDRFMAVRECDYHFEERCTVLSESDYRKRTKEVAEEAALIAKAMQMARNEWMAEDRERVKALRDQADAQMEAQKNPDNNTTTTTPEIHLNPFPRLKAINTDPQVRSLGLYATQSEAEARCRQQTEMLAQKRKTAENGDKAGSRMEARLPSKLAKPDSVSRGGGGGSPRADAEAADVAKASAMFEACFEQLKSMPEEDKPRGLARPDKDPSQSGISHGLGGPSRDKGLMKKPSKPIKTIGK